jgi:hypothetical protein
MERALGGYDTSAPVTDQSLSSTERSFWMVRHDICEQTWLSSLGDCYSAAAWFAIVGFESSSIDTSYVARNRSLKIYAPTRAVR